MQKLTVKLENCYGIKKLEHEFNFSNFKTFALYAPNGVMKTSFAKTLTDYISGENSNDKVFNCTPYTREIKSDNDTDIDQGCVFVIKSFIDTNYTSNELSTLLVRSELREKYEKALKSMADAKSIITKTLKQTTQSSDCESEIIRTFSEYGDNLFEILEKLVIEVSKSKYRDYNFKYNNVFENDVVKKFVEKNKNNLQIYHDKYFEILNSSDNFFSVDEGFGTAEASGLADAISDGSFFNAGHQIQLKNEQTISSAQAFNEIVEEQIKKVVDDPELRKQFDAIDKALRPKNIQPLKEEIEKDKSLLLELSNYAEFQRKYWKSHLSKILSQVTSLNTIYSEKKEEIAIIIAEANNESAEWKSTIGTFKRRFVNLPFEVEVKNTKDSVLGLSKPELGIKFIDHTTGTTKEIERGFLSENILSQGEKRAFYLLNIIFEIRARLLKGHETLFIIDDIADSFDYKNKYAIVEYLKDLSKENNFHSIILTHNFDFFRTVQSRILTESFKRTHSFVAEKINGEIRLIDAGSRNVTDPFSTWKGGVNDNEKHLLACIPFVRNLIEFKEGKTESYKLLTHVLHIKSQDGAVKPTADIEISDLEPSFSSTLSNTAFTFPDKTKKVVQVIDEQILAIKNLHSKDSIVLEDKIILAIGIRLKAEDYMWSKVTDKSVISGSQTGKLYDRYKTEFANDTNHENTIKTLERVNIMTPENIHLNSFMYEPILDMGIGELVSLHDEVLALTT